MRQQIINMMAAGLSKKVILDSLDISAEYLAEILKDKEFTKDALEARESITDDRIDAKYAKAEEQVLDRITENITFADFNSTLKALETINKARISRRLPVQQSGHYQNPTIGISVTVPLFLNSQGTSNVVMDSNKQVVAIDGRNMAAMPVAQVQKLFKSFDTEEKTLKRDLEGEYYDPIIEEHKRDSAAEAA